MINKHQNYPCGREPSQPRHNNAIITGALCHWANSGRKRYSDIQNWTKAKIREKKNALTVHGFLTNSQGVQVQIIYQTWMGA